ncbi:MAG: hypothetical protein A3G34_08255 [Candidatus Lindowbacteria bacterium RIFCSPLOWO2_12_FULL_62_27]|nr:MAG: hypothetical protein A3G34_08255 [Candidatus Lindowbacteria bacterium RIFCSPLOWO2_12_FULL_62_27]
MSLLLLSILYMASLGLVCPSEVRAAGALAGSVIAVGGDGGAANVADVTGDIVATVTSPAGNDTKFATTPLSVSATISAVYGDSLARLSPDTFVMPPPDTAWHDVSVTNAGNATDSLLFSAASVKRRSNGFDVSDSVVISFWEASGATQISSLNLPPDSTGNIKVAIFVKPTAPRNDTIDVTIRATARSGAGGDSGGYIGFNNAPYAGRGDDTVGLPVGVINRKPIANAGPDTGIVAGSTVALSGAASSDPDGDSLSYQWTQETGPVMTLTPGATAANPSFASDSAYTGAYVFRLTVTDVYGDSSFDTIRISAGNIPPVANAGPDTSVPNNDTATLNGAGSSDGNGDSLTYSWTKLSGPTASINNPASAVASVFMTNKGVYVFQLGVSDAVDTTFDTVQITALNTKPVAITNPDTTVSKKDTVYLSGAASTDADTGDSLTYTWTQLSGPFVSLMPNSLVVNPAFVSADSVTKYVFQMVVSDGTDTAADTVEITAVNAVPVANAGIDHGTAAGSTDTLTGSGSTDADSDPLTYRWTQLSSGAPTVTLTPSFTVSTPTFVLDTSFIGDYVFQLEVNDGFDTSAPDTVRVTAGNVAPVANAGPDTMSVPNNDTVTLNGAGSSDANGDTLAYLWSKLSGPAASINNASAAVASVFMTNKGVYVFQLRVNDAVDTSYDTVLVTVLNTLPVSNAGLDTTRPNNDTILLVGVASTDSDAGDALTYSWTQLSGLAVTINNPTAATASVYMTLKGTYVFQLVVNDGTDTNADTVQDTVVNTKPIADAGPATATVTKKDTVFLNAAASTDADTEDTLTYNWTRITGPLVSLVPGPSAANPAFASADSVTQYLFQVVVDDGTDTATDTILITATNTPPVANAGLDVVVPAGSVDTLNGSASMDTNGDPLTYRWTQTANGAPTVALTPSFTVASPTFVLDTAFMDTYIFQLEVNDGFDTSAPDTVRVTAGNVPPAANAGPDAMILHPDTITLSGLASTDLNGDTLAYTWSQVSGPTTPAILGANTATPSVLIDSYGVYVFRLRVFDGKDTSAPDDIICTGLNTPPLASVAGSDTVRIAGDTVTLSGAASTDSNGDRITFAWTQAGGPASVTLSSATAPNPFFVPTVSGLYSFTLTVSDGLNSGADTVDVTVLAGAATGVTFPDTHLLADDTGMVTIRVTIRDVNGNPTPGETVTFTQRHPSSLILAAVPTNGSGQAELFFAPDLTSSFHKIEAQVGSTGASRFFYAYSDKLSVPAQADSQPGKGWRMWAPNKTPDTPTVARVVQGEPGAPSTLGSGVPAYVYEWVTSVDSANAFNKYRTPSKIVRGRAYWVKDHEGGLMQTPGVPDTNVTVYDTLVGKGWHQIGSGQFYFVDWDNAVKFSTTDSGEDVFYQPTSAAFYGMIKNAIYWRDDAIGNYWWGPDSAGPNNLSPVLMKPMAGFWLWVDTDAVVMRIDPKPAYPDSVASQVLNQSPRYLAGVYRQKGLTGNEANWAIQLAAQGSGISDVQNYVGVMPTADAASKSSLFEPPAVASGYLTLGIRDKDQPDAPLAAASYAPPVTTAKSWDVEVYTDLTDPVTLTWDNIDNIPENYDVYLVTPTGTVDMRKSSSVVLQSKIENLKSKISMTLAVGLPEYLAAFLAAPLAKDHTFVYPNPGPDGAGIMNFKHNITSGEVKITIFDVGGRMVRELSGTASPILWDTTNRFGQKVASGVYIYIVEASGARMVDKLAVVR